MKYIGGIDTFRFEPKGMTVKIAPYHRSATGLLSKTKVYLLPRIAHDGKIREVVVCPFHPRSWAYIWTLEVSSTDRPGLIRDITKILRDEDVNIFIQESPITNYDQDFTVSLVADFYKYFRKRDNSINGKIKPKQLIEFKMEIKRLFEAANPHGDKKIEVDRFEQIKFLIANSEEVDKRTNAVDADVLNQYYAAGYRSIGIEQKALLIEDRLLRDLELREFVDEAEYIQGTLFSDSEEKFFIVRFFSNNQLVVSLEITHANSIGAIHKFTDTIHNINEKYNIISCYNRIQDDQDAALWYVLIDVTDNFEQVPALIKNLRGISNPTVQDVRVLDYTESLIIRADQEGIALPPSVGQQVRDQTRTRSEEKELDDLRESLRTTNASLVTLNRKEREIDAQVRRRLGWLIIAIILIILLLIWATAFQWEHSERWIVLAALLVPFCLICFQLILIFKHSGFPTSVEQLRTAIRDKLIYNAGYEFQGENSLDSQISNLTAEIQEKSRRVDDRENSTTS